uniref:Nudix hydrolase domain-containing protein n=1 Tax=Haptolina ericina TaxID=156174 RepID=A0A7S3B1E2_9EUKA
MSAYRIEAVLGLCCLLVCFLVPLSVRNAVQLEQIEIYTLSTPFARRNARDWESSSRLPPLVEINEADLVTDGTVAPIGRVHSRGLLHRGVWLFVTDPRQRILLIQRSRKVVTCPDAWGIVGEHSAPSRETWEATARRALHEELGVSKWASVKVDMLGKPVLFRSDYGIEGGLASVNKHQRKRDVQATAILVASLPASVAYSLSTDTEVNATRWVTRSLLNMELRTDAWAVGSTLIYNDTSPGEIPPSIFCNAKIRDLLQLALNRLADHAAAEALRLRPVQPSTARRSGFTMD